jgi:hypothetical protein
LFWTAFPDEGKASGDARIIVVVGDSSLEAAALAAAQDHISDSGT